MKADIDDSWKPYLNSEFEKDYMNSLKEFLKTQDKFLPKTQDVFKALKYTSLDNCKVVILGQDPYPTPGDAMGLAFSVNQGQKIPKSLNNIYKELKSDLNIEAANHGDLSSWAKQGVLLLNTTLTVYPGKPASHSKQGWEIFTDRAIETVSEQKDFVVFILWGKHAQSKEDLINDKHFIIKSPHPSPFAAYSGFFNSKPFSRTNKALEYKGLDSINWELK